MDQGFLSQRDTGDETDYRPGDLVSVFPQDAMMAALDDNPDEIDDNFAVKFEIAMVIHEGDDIVEQANIVGDAFEAVMRDASAYLIDKSFGTAITGNAADGAISIEVAKVSAEVADDLDAGIIGPQSAQREAGNA